MNMQIELQDKRADRIGYWQGLPLRSMTFIPVCWVLLLLWCGAILIWPSLCEASEKCSEELFSKNAYLKDTWFPAFAITTVVPALLLMSVIDGARLLRLQNKAHPARPKRFRFYIACAGALLYALSALALLATFVLCASLMWLRVGGLL